MDHLGAAEGASRDSAPPPGQTGDVHGDGGDAQEAHRVWRPASTRRHSTRGGSGTAAGSTPKKAYRPSSSSRHRPAGKKPDGERH
jgi:hypothetical protein